MQNNQAIYITNFWYAINYGANLTAYALYKICSEISCETYLLDNLYFKNKLHYSNSYVKTFIEKYIKIKKFCNEPNAILISGSDQVFNPDCEPEYLNSHLLDFALPGNKKIAISASFGVGKDSFLTNNSEEIIKKMREALNTFDAVSVREKSGIEICIDIFGINSECIIDPVFILDKNKWIELSENSSINAEDKIVSYVFAKTKEHDKAYKYLTKKYNSSVLEFDDFKKSPEDFVSAIRKCKLLITDSFHAVCFAIIFNKPFICIAKKNNRVERFNSLFEIFEIQNQCITLEQIYENDCIFAIDYSNVNEIIEKERQKGLNYLQNVIQAPTEIDDTKLEARISYLETKVNSLEEQCSLKYQLKKIVWEKWLIIYEVLPKPVQHIIIFFKDFTKKKG